MDKLKVIIVEDHPIFRKGLALLIEQTKEYQVVGEASSVKEAIELIEQNTPDITIIDLTLKESNGLDLIKELKTSSPNVKILVISMHDEDIYAERVLRAGAHGYIMKEQASTNTIDALNTIMENRYYISQSIQEKLLQSTISVSKKSSESAIYSLSDREFQVFQLIGQGLGVIEIASQLSLSVKTIESYRNNLKIKLKLNDAAALRKFAIRWLQTKPRG